MATATCDKCKKTYQVPPWLYGVRYNNENKTLCKSCYRRFCEEHNEADKRFWGVNKGR